MGDRMRNIAERIHSAWQRHGFRLFGPLLLHNVKHYAKMYRKNGRFGQPKSSVDAIPGVETYRAAYFSELQYEGDSASSANPYEPVREEEFQAVFAKLGVNFANYHFVDVGSGKGRALLLGARMGFQQVTGLEYSKDLHEAARHNIEAAKGHWPNTDSISLLQGDASLFMPPSPPIVFYLFNPFGKEVMTKFIDNVAKSLRATEGDAWIVYGNPVERPVIDAESLFEFKFSHAGHAIFRRVSA